MFLYFYNCSGISYSVVIFRVKMQTKKKNKNLIQKRKLARAIGLG